MKEKNYLANNFHLLDKVFSKNKKLIVIERLDDTKILIYTDDKLADNIILKNVVTLMTFVKKDDDKIYPQLFLGETLYGE